MTRTLLDNALLLQAIAGSDNIDDRCTGPSPSSIPKYHTNLTSLPDPTNLSGIKIGILSESLTMPGIDPRILSLFNSSVKKFSSLGATVQEVSVPFHVHGSTVWTGVSKASGYLNRSGHAHGRRGLALTDLASKLHPMKQENWEKAYPSTKNIYLNGVYAQEHFPGLIGKATNLSRKLRDEYNKAFEEVDVLVLPNLPYIANSHGKMMSEGAGVLEGLEKQVGLTGNTAPFNQSGHPVLAMPIGMLEIEEGPLKGSGRKLPVSMQVVGKWWNEEMVYRVGYAWSEGFDWKTL
jgi:amidase